VSLGVPRDQVTQDYLLTNEYLYTTAARTQFEKRVGRLPDGVQLHARYLDAALDTITTEYGSFDAYLREGLGIDDATLDRLRKKFLE
jgi:protein-tyrosine phosphatase